MLHRAEDLDHSKMSGGSNSSDLFFFNCHSPKPNITITHGLRTGATQSMICLANKTTGLINWKKKSEFSRQEYMHWEDNLAGLSAEEQKRNERLIEDLKHKFRKHALHFLTEIDLASTYAANREKVLEIHQQFCTMNDIRSIIPTRLIAFRTIVLSIFAYFGEHVMTFDDPTFFEDQMAKMWEESFTVKLCCCTLFLSINTLFV